jgi:Sigma-54 interaction domain
MAWPDEISGPYRFNILIVGPERAAEAELQRLRPLLPGSVHTCRLPGPLHLPKAGGAALVLRNVGALDPEQQTQLSQWLESGEHGPVVSLHSSSLFDRVREGAFSEQLYYRLNIVLETADTPGKTTAGGE